jgi:hypothetical protein
MYTEREMLVESGWDTEREMLVESGWDGGKEVRTKYVEGGPETK